LKIISTNTRFAISIGTALAVIAAAGTATARALSVLGAIDNRLAKVENKVADQYTLAVASEVALRTAIENPGMRVPDPRDPNRIIQVTPTTPHTPTSRP
jgi:hypothetical protein